MPDARKRHGVATNDPMAIRGTRQSRADYATYVSNAA